MGQLSDGHALDWEAAAAVCAYVRRRGATQFLAQFRRFKNVSHNCWTWGDELEYILVRFDHERRRVVLLLRADAVIQALEALERGRTGLKHAEWRPEYTSYMVEGTPGAPYTGDNSCLDQIERSMQRRRELITSRLSVGAGEAVLAIAVFPLLGVGVHTLPHENGAGGPAARSLYVSDDVICQSHPRFATLTQNIRKRRGEKVKMLVPMFRDSATSPRSGVPTSAEFDAVPDYMIHMDAMAFGMGCCCLQVTFQVTDLSDARFLYDQMAVLAPIFLAITAASPYFRGFLADIDCRWRVIAGSVDDRTRVERGEAAPSSESRRLHKSRYDSISAFLSEDAALDSAFHNDVPCEVDGYTLDYLMGRGVDYRLARHVAHLFVRDPLVIYNEGVFLDDSHTTAHFENIQSTNWNTVRFKLPPTEGNIGWRVEFRSMEISLTDYENAAFTCLISILARMVLMKRLVFYMPLSQVDENMERAHARGAVRTQKFFMRRHVHGADAMCADRAACDRSIGELSIDEIFNGGPQFVGLLNIAREYVEDTEFDSVSTSDTVLDYLRFIGERAAGRLPTTAEFLREQVVTHAEYAHDSQVGPGIAYDLMMLCNQIGNGTVHPEGLLGPFGRERRVYEGENATYGRGGCRPSPKAPAGAAAHVP